MMDAVLSVLLEITVYSAVITAVILLFRAVFRKKISPRLQYLLWGVLILRLLLPVTVESGFHVESLFPAPAAETVEAETPVLTPVQPRASQAAPSGAAAAPAVPSVPAATQPAARRMLDWKTAVLAVWVVGMLVSLLFTLYARQRFVRRLKRTVTANVLDARRLLTEQKRALGIRQKVCLLTTTTPLSPSLALIRGQNVLILPAELTDKTTLRYAVAHELVHCRRRDQYALVLLCLLRAVYWFNPLLWYAFAEMRADMETACDAEVLSLLKPEEKRGYLTALLHLFTRQPQPYVGMALAQTRRIARQRMKGAFMKQKTSKPVLILTVLLTLLLAVGCFTTACQPTPVAAVPVDHAVNRSAGDETERSTAQSASGGPETDISGNTVTVTDTSGSVTVTVTDGGAMQGSDTQTPRNGGVSPVEAAAAAVRTLRQVYGGAFTETGATVYFHNMPELSSEFYDVYFGGSGNTAAYQALVNAVSGETLSVEKPLPNTQDALSPEWDDPAYDWDKVGNAALAEGKAIVERVFANGRAILDDSYFDGIQATYQEPDPACVDVYIHMSEGACYSLRLLYPSLSVNNVSVYPDGWAYCMEQTWHPEYMAPGWTDAATDGAVPDSLLAEIAMAATEQVGSAFDKDGFTDELTYSQAFASAVYGQAGIDSWSGDDVTTGVEWYDDSAKPGVQITLCSNADGTGAQRTGILVDTGGRYAYADFATGKIAYGEVQQELGTAYRAFRYAQVILPEAGAAGTPTPAPTLPPVQSEREALIAKTALALVGQDMTGKLPLTGDAREDTRQFTLYVFTEAGVENKRAMHEQITSVEDERLIAGYGLWMTVAAEDFRRAIYVGDGQYVMLDSDTNTVKKYALADALNEYTSISVLIPQ